jgi:hypothetical protein
VEAAGELSLYFCQAREHYMSVSRFSLSFGLSQAGSPSLRRWPSASRDGSCLAAGRSELLLCLSNNLPLSSFVIILSE